MKPLVDVELLRIRLSLMDHPDVISALESIISSTQTFFEERLDTKLLKLSNTDYFNLDTTMLRHAPNGFYRFKLKNANIRTFPTPTLIGTSSYSDLLAGTDITVFDEQKGQYYIDPIKGVLYLNKEMDASLGGYRYPRIDSWGGLATGTLNGYYKVTYASGFTSISETPNWLGEAIIAYAPFLAQQQQAFTKNEAKNDTFDESKSLAFKLLEPYMRDVGMVISPMRSISVP